MARLRRARQYGMTYKVLLKRRKFMALDNARIQSFHREMHSKFRGTETGTLVPYLDKVFIVHKNVFWPGDDSKRTKPSARSGGHSTKPPANERPSFLSCDSSGASRIPI